MSQHQYKFNKNDEYYTPEYAVVPILKRLKPGSVIWCPFDTKESNFVKIFKENGFKVIHTHIFDGQDFFKEQVPECDYIISNPPYSLKGKIIKRLFEIEKPFAMLINMQSIFDSKERFQMLQKNWFEILMLSPRVQYIKSDGEVMQGVPFQSCYLCSKICKEQIEFEYVERE